MSFLDPNTRTYQADGIRSILFFKRIRHGKRNDHVRRRTVLSAFSPTTKDLRVPAVLPLAARNRYRGIKQKKCFSVNDLDSMLRLMSVALSPPCDTQPYCDLIEKPKNGDGVWCCYEKPRDGMQWR